jgi:hypothetical protein
MKIRLAVWAFLAALFLSVLASPLQAQSSNADLVKMIQAGLPEALIISKIHEGAGHWDTSVDALIALKNAGATAAELDAFATPSGPATGAQASPPAIGSAAPIEAFGGQLFRTRSGDPYLQFQSNKPGIFPDGRPSNTAWLVTYRGDVAILIPSSLLLVGDQTDCNPSNVLFLRDKVIVDSYIVGGCGTMTKYNIQSADSTRKNRYIPQSGGFLSLSRQGLRMEKGKELSFLQRQTVDNARFGLSYDTIVSEGGKKGVKTNFLFGIFPLNFTKLGPETAMRSPMMEAFVDQLLSNFDATILEFERVAGVSDPMAQLPPGAHYEATTAEQTQRYWALMSQGYQEAQQNRTGDGFGSFMNVMQGVQNIASAQSMANAAAANRDMAGQMQAAMSAGKAEVQTINAIGNANAAPIQPLPSSSAAQPSIQAATNQQMANIQAKQAQVLQAQQKPAPKSVAAVSAPPVASAHSPAKATAPSSGTAQPPVPTSATAAPPPSPGTQTPCPNVTPGLLQTQGCVPASCMGMNHVVHLESELFPYGPKVGNTEVVGYFTNNSISDVTCTWAFHKGGQWTEVGTGLIKAGATHQGGQGGGIWTTGADSWDMKYACFEGHDPVDAQGHICTVGVVFSGQTSAGTDIR